MAETVSSFDTNRALEDEVKASLVDGKLPCAMAFKVAKKLKVSPRKVGDTANNLNVKDHHAERGGFS